MVELPLIGWSPRDVDRESQCRLGAEPQVDDVEADEAHFCGADSEGPGDRLAYLVAGPPRSKLAAVLFDGADKLGKLRVAGVLTCGRAELGEETVAALFPVDPRPAVLGLAERHPHGVAPAFGESVGPPDRGEGLVPRDEVEARIDDACWRRQQRVEEPSELASHAIGDRLGDRGQEFGATTGRKRRCGWFDAVAVRRARQINGFSGLCITKLDVLDGLDTVKICVAYEVDGKRRGTPPAAAETLARCQPVYEEMPGWGESTVGIRRLEELPANARRYLDRRQEPEAIRMADHAPLDEIHALHQAITPAAILQKLAIPLHGAQAPPEGLDVAFAAHPQVF